ncbi:MAG: HAD hydrolase-like protein [Proteobacteria bacterium]|nr:HAD hydrolase-like protein [Pseudomonadota bacterium]
MSAGSLVPTYFREHALAGARTAVLGPPDSAAFVAEGGGEPVALTPTVEIDVLVVCDDAGFPFLEGLELALNAVVRAILAGRRPVLILPNPDLIYPKGDGALGITAGSIALVIEHALARRFPTAPLAFVHLGKPVPRIFVEAARHLGVPLDRVCAIGDQLETDIAGARAAGIACALVEGVSRWSDDAPRALAPTYLLATIDPT